MICIGDMGGCIDHRKGRHHNSHLPLFPSVAFFFSAEHECSLLSAVLVTGDDENVAANTSRDATHVKTNQSSLIACLFSNMDALHKHPRLAG